MFDIGWTEMLVIAIVMIVVVGPKDLPKMLRTFGRTTAKMRSMAGDFRKQFDDAMREAELDEVRSTIDSVRKMNPAADVKKALNPMEKAAADVRAGLEKTLKPSPPPQASPVAQPVEPAKTGATAMPGETSAPAEAKPVEAKSAAAPAKAAAKKPVAAKAPATKAAAKPAPKVPAKSAAAKPAASKSAAGKKASAKP